jgi:hypothetical protein
MAIDDIYKSKAQYEKRVDNINNKNILAKPNDYKRKYYCKNESNLKYYNRLIRIFEVDDLSYKRRLRLLDTLNQLVFFIECNLKDATSIEKEDVIINIRKITATSNLKKTGSDIRQIGRMLFNDDELPSFFKEFKIKTDISRQEARKDKLTWDDYDFHV